MPTAGTPLGEDKSDFEALMAFRNLNEQERMEMLFLGSRNTIRIGNGVNLRLDKLNGTTKDTKENLDKHLDEHESQQEGIDYIKRWGGRSSGVILFVLALIGGLAMTVQILAYFR